MDSLQSLMDLTSLVCTVLNFQLAMALVVESVAVDGNTDMTAVNAVADTISMNLVTYLGLMGAWTTANSILLDIPQHEEEMMKQFATHTHLCIDDLTDTACHKMTHFCHGQLRRLYTAFHLGNRGNHVVELRCQSLQLSEVWHCIRLEQGIVSDDGRGPLLHISLDLCRGPFLEPAKERAGNDK